MNNIDNQVPSSDPELDALLGLLRETPARDSQAVERGRAKFISDVDLMLASSNPTLASWLDKLFTIGVFSQSRGHRITNRSMRLSYSIALVALVVALFLFSGAGITAYAAQSALPGDALYRIKTSIEQTRVRLAADAAIIAELHLGFAERRLEEISGLIAERRYGDIERAAQEFEYHVQQALIAMQTVAAGDPLRAQELAARVTTALSEYARSLAGMMINVPESSRGSIQRAIDTSQGLGGMTPDDLSENGNEAVNENIIDDHGNTNGGYNDGQSNQNGVLINENENDNDDSNTNLNSNENDDVNDDHGSNSNLNDRDNDNHNDSGGNDHNDNRGDNDNEHGRDDNGNGDNEHGDEGDD